MVTRQLIVVIIICCCTIISAIMHHEKLEKVNGGVLAVMLEIMMDQLREFQQLTGLSIGEQVKANKCYCQNFTHE